MLLSKMKAIAFLFAAVQLCLMQCVYGNDKPQLDGKHWISQFNMVPQGDEDEPHVSPLIRFGELTRDLPDTYPPDATRYSGSWSYALFQENDISPFVFFPGRLVITLLRDRPLEVYVIDPNSGNLTTTTIGIRMADGFAAIIPKGSIFGLRLKRRKLPGGLALVGYTAFPELNPDDVTTLDQEELMKNFPKHKRAIRRVSKPTK